MNPFTSTLFKRAFKGLLHVEMPVALDLTEPDRLLVVAPHPDDETFGCGGTLSLLAQGPCQVRVLIVSDGAKGDPLRLLEEDVVTVRRNETLKALQQIGVLDVVFLNHPDGNVAHDLKRLDQDFKEAFDVFKPTWVFSVGLRETHRDHVIVAVMVLLQWFRQGMKSRLLFYEVFGGFQPNRIVDITSAMADKKRMMEAYALPAKYVNYSDLVIALNRYRGGALMSAHQTLYAEAFYEFERRAASVLYVLIAPCLLAIWLKGMLRR